MQVRLEKSWQNQLAAEFDASYFKGLTNFVRQEYQQYKCFPPGKDIFNALDSTPFESVRVVLLGQDPYHGPGQANGLCFSVPDGIAHPPSLVNIFKELEQDLGKPYPKSGDLSLWASQGVLLLNATLTVAAHQAGSHQNRGWEQFTDAVIRTISTELEGVVFLLWGGFAKRKQSLIAAEKHKILTSGHPSPLSANRGYWFGNQHFSKTNAYLQSHGNLPIQW